MAERKMVMNEKETVNIKIPHNGKFFYIQYGNGAEWEEINISDFPSVLKALLNTLISGEYAAVIEVM